MFAETLRTAKPDAREPDTPQFIDTFDRLTEEPAIEGGGEIE